MTPQTQRKLETAIDRLLNEIGGADYDGLMGSVPPVILHALFSAIGFVKIFPGLEDLNSFSARQQKIITRANLRNLLNELEEPSPEELRSILSGLKLLPSLFKRGLTDAAAEIRPRGGPPEKLSPADVQRVTDEFFDRQKNGEESSAIRKEIIKREGISDSTLRRRIREEKKRRAHLSPLLEDANNSKIKK